MNDRIGPHLQSSPPCRAGQPRPQKEADRSDGHAGARVLDGALTGLLEGSGAGFCLVDRKRRIQWANDTFRDWFGLTGGPGTYCFTAHRQFGTTHPECPALRAFKSGRPEESENVTLTTAGKRFLRFMAVPLLDAGSHVTMVLEMVLDITRKKKAEDEVLKLSKLNESIISNAPVAIFTLDTSGVITSTNPAHMKLAGAPREKLVGFNWMTTPKSRETGLTRHLARGLAGEPFELVNFRYLNYKGDRELYMTVKGVPLKNEDGQIEGLLCIIEDTTDKTRVEKEVRALKQLNENVIQSISNGIVVLDRSLRVKTWNRGAEAMFGIQARDVMGEEFQAIVRPEEWDCWHARLVRALDTGESVEERKAKCRLGHRGTLTVNLRVSPLYSEELQITGVILLFEDISAQEKIELRYENLFETAKDGIFVTDREGRFLSLNRGAERMFGASRQALLGAPFPDLVPERYRDYCRRVLAGVLEGAELPPVELEIRSGNGELIPVEVSVTTIREDGQVVGVQGILRDIRERKKMESQLVQAGKMAAIGKLAASIAHEINNPLASIAGYAEELLDQYRQLNGHTADVMPDLPEYLSVIEQQAYRCKNITQNLLNFSRDGPIQLEEVDVHQVLDAAVKLVQHEARLKNKQVERLYAPSPARITADFVQLQQVFLNILNNALDATADDGHITITTVRDGNVVQVTISDDGCGIPTEHLDRVFDPFFTTKPAGRGTGLGLSICYNIVKRLGGDIAVHSSPGEGTTFVISLPANRTGEGVQS